jgi:hypothetical protein
MAKNDAARRYIQELIRTEKARLGLTFEDVSERLRAYGIRQTATNLRTKLGRGDMGAQLFLSLMKVLEVEELRLERLQLGAVASGPRKSATPAGRKPRSRSKTA